MLGPASHLTKSRRRSAPAARAHGKTAAPLAWFAELGARVAQAWEATGRAEEAFSPIACEALDRTPPSAHVDPEVLVASLLTPAELPLQVDIEGRFSDLPITVYDDNRFFVQVLYWTDGTPTVHDHNFVGAFHVLAGSSIQSTYGFREARRFGPRIRTGVITPLGIELLRAGDVRPILRGERFIHGVFHLDRPSVSVVVRTHAKPDDVLFAYDQPGLAWDIFYADEPLRRRLQALRLRHTLGADYFDAACTALRTADEIGVARILLQAYELHPDAPETARALVGIAREGRGLRDGRERAALVSALAPVLDELPKLHPLLGARRAVHDPDLRYALAVLLSAPTRRAALALTAQWVRTSNVGNAAPEDVMTAWVGELMGRAGPGSGLEEHRLLTTEPRIVAFRAMLEGQNDAGVAAELSEFYGARAPLDVDGVAALRAELRGSLLLRALVTD
jgi:hypothetical protein